MGWIVSASAMFAVGGALMKQAAGFASAAPAAIALVCFLIGGCLTIMSLRAAPLGPVTIMSLGVEAAFSVAVGRYAFGEHLSVVQLTGIALIVAGVATVRLA